MPGDRPQKWHRTDQNEGASPCVEDTPSLSFGLSRGLLVDAHIVYRHELREQRGFVRRPWPVSSNCDVEDEKERVVEWRVEATGGHVLLCRQLEVRLIVHQPRHGVRRPLQRKDVVFV